MLFYKKEFNVLDAPSAIKQNKDYLHDRDQFKFFGIHAFFGEQGSGKTTALVRNFLAIRSIYPKAITCSNIILKDLEAISIQDYLQGKLTDTYKQYVFYSNKDEYKLVNETVRNGKYGVIMLTDEYQNYFSNQDSRNVPEWVIEQLAQNRKQARVHLVTSQDYDQLAKAVRRRTTYAINCKTYAFPFSFGKVFTVYWVYDAKKISDKFDFPRPRFIGFFVHSSKLRNAFDTYQVVFTGDSNTTIYSAYNQTINVQNIKKVTTKKRLRMFGFR